MPTCASCQKHVCCTPSLDGAPANCPSLCQSAQELDEMYPGAEMDWARNAALVEAEGYCRNTRVEEIMDFAYKNGFHTIGLAFCSGLRAEAALFARVLRANGFAVESVICKNGGFDKSCLGLSPEQTVGGEGFEAMCNPAGQARFLNEAHTELNVILGLCVGHDTLFIRHSEAPVTVLAAKDRVLGHNPLPALYQLDSYFGRLLRFIETKYGPRNP